MENEVFNLNLEQTEILEIPLSPVGEGEFEIRKAEQKESGPNSKYPGSPYFNFMLVDLNTPDASPIFHMVNIPNKDTKNPTLTANQLIKFFTAAGVDHRGDFRLEDFIGKTIKCIVKHEEYEGNMQARIKDVVLN